MWGVCAVDIVARISRHVNPCAYLVAAVKSQGLVVLCTGQHIETWHLHANGGETRGAVVAVMPQARCGYGLCGAVILRCMLG
jgi:hypothetical protein